jgi:hypothetical protein
MFLEVLFWLLDSFKILNLIILGNILTLALIGYLIWTLYGSYLISLYDAGEDWILDKIDEYDDDFNNLLALVNRSSTLQQTQSTYTTP